MPSQQSTLLFQVATPGVSRRDVRAFAKRLETEVAAGRPFGCLISCDEELRRLNLEFRGCDYATDVLSFPQHTDPLVSCPPRQWGGRPGPRRTPRSGSSMAPQKPADGGVGLGPGRLPHNFTHGTLGEIAISFETARRQAAEFRHGVAQEIGILMLHGLLHLLGMDHESDRGHMLRAEQKWRARLGLPAGLIERARA